MLDPSPYFSSRQSIHCALEILKHSMIVVSVDSGKNYRVGADFERAKSALLLSQLHLLLLFVSVLLLFEIFW